jgi:hypothetical protein
MRSHHPSNIINRNAVAANPFRDRLLSLEAGL